MLEIKPLRMIEKHIDTKNKIQAVYNFFAPLGISFYVWTEKELGI